MPDNEETALRKGVNVMNELPGKSTNLDYLREVTKNNSAVIKEIVAAYLKETPRMMNLIRESIHTENWEQLRKTIHSMIPSFLAMGISKEFETMSRKIEQLGVNLKDKKLGKQERIETVAELNDLFTKIETVCLQACEELKNESFAGK